MTQDAVRQIEESIQRDRQHIDLAVALSRLQANRDFKLVIGDGYLQKESIRLVHLKADPSMQTAERQLSVLTQIDAIGGLLQYFHTLVHSGSIAAKSIETSEAVRDEMLAEGGDE